MGPMWAKGLRGGPGVAPRVERGRHPGNTPRPTCRHALDTMCAQGTVQ